MKSGESIVLTGLNLNCSICGEPVIVNGICQCDVVIYPGDIHREIMDGVWISISAECKPCSEEKLHEVFWEFRDSD